MTHLIKSFIQHTNDPTHAAWFDVGQLAQFRERALDAEKLMQTPFDRCAICGTDAEGDAFVLFVHRSDGSLTISGITRTRHHGNVVLDPFAVVRMQGESLGLHRAKDAQQARVAVVIVADWLDMLDTSGANAYQPTVKLHPANQSRITKGKPPLFFSWKTVVVAPRKPSSPLQGGTHASPRAHDRRGHWRLHPSGKRVWVKSCRVGDAGLGAVFKDYKLSGDTRQGG